MVNGKRLIVLVGILLLMWGCESARQNTRLDGDFVLQPGMKVYVQDVRNDTKEILDVDVIGLFWNALQVALKNKELLWPGEGRRAPVQLDAHVLKYKKGNALQRWTMPGFGSTVLNARIDLMEGDRLLCSIEVYRTVDLGDGLTRGGWRTVFTDAAEDAVNMLLTRSAP